jgi:hypothetical protein
MNPAVIETRMGNGATRWRPSLVDATYKTVWRGGLFKTAEDALADAQRQLEEVSR